MAESNETKTATPINGYAIGICAAVLGTAAYLTGVSLENETLRNIMDYVVGAEYIEPLAAKQGYVGMMKLAGGAAVAGGLVGIVCNGMLSLFGKKDEKAEKGEKKADPAKKEEPAKTN